MMPRPAFIVEGKTEQKFLSSICGKKCPVRLLRCGGRDASMTAVADRVSIHFDLFTRYSPVVILFDREDRKESSSDLRFEFLLSLENNKIIRENNIDISVARVGVPDKMIENWIIADHVLMRREFGSTFTEELYDGEGGKSLLKKLMKNAPFRSARSYKEIRDGVEFLKKMNVHRAAINSPSLQILLDALDIKNCRWLNK